MLSQAYKYFQFLTLSLNILAHTYFFKSFNVFVISGHSKFGDRAQGRLSGRGHHRKVHSAMDGERRRRFRNHETIEKVQDRIPRNSGKLVDSKRV